MALTQDWENEEGVWSGVTLQQEPFDLPNMLHGVAVIAAQACGGVAAAVNMRTSNGDYTVVADTHGLLMRSKTSEAFWQALLQNGRRVANSYLISLEHARPVSIGFPSVRLAGPAPPSVPTGDIWSAYNMLVVPLRTGGGVMMGHICVDRPLGEGPPGPKLLSVLDVLARHAALTVEMSRREERLRSLLHAVSDVIVLLDRHGMIRYISPYLERVLGHASDDRVGSSIFEGGLIHPEDKAGVRDVFAGVTAVPRSEARMEFRLRHRDGSWHHVEAVTRNALDDPNVEGIVTSIRDVSDRKECEDQLRYQALHDALTGLPNRVLFMERLEDALLRATRRQKSVAVLYLDSDCFKRVNDSLGHAAGDRLLSAIGWQLRSCLRPADTGARLGGDEFAVLLEDIGHISETVRVAERVEEALRTPFEVAGHQILLTVSIGIAVSTAGQSDPSELLQAADTAMYAAKRSGKAHYEIYSPEINSRSLQPLQMERLLHSRSDREELRPGDLSKGLAPTVFSPRLLALRTIGQSGSKVSHLAAASEQALGLQVVRKCIERIFLFRCRIRSKPEIADAECFDCRTSSSTGCES